jgi:hypothetical protein
MDDFLKSLNRIVRIGAWFTGLGGKRDARIAKRDKKKEERKKKKDARNKNN